MTPGTRTLRGLWASPAVTILSSARRVMPIAHPVRWASCRVVPGPSIKAADRQTRISLCGRITWGPEDGAGVIVDGIPLTLQELGKFLALHEGWQLQLKITDSLE